MTDSPQQASVQVSLEKQVLHHPLLTTRFDHLLKASEAAYKTYQKPPDWWVQHLEEHVVSGSAADHPNTEDLEPSLRSFLLSLLWIGLQVGMWVWLYRFQGLAAHRTFLLVCLGLPAVATICILFATMKSYSSLRWKSRYGTETLGWCLSRLVFPPLSLYLAVRELVAWIAWRRNGRRWVFKPWEEERAIREEVQRFEKEGLGPKRKALAEADRRRTALQTISNPPTHQARRYCKEAETAKKEGKILLAKSLDRAAAFEEKRACQLRTQADLLGERIKITEERFRTLDLQLTTYKDLQESRVRLRGNGSLLPDDATDIEQREVLRAEYLGVLEGLQQIEAVFQPAATETSAADDRSGEQAASDREAAS